MFFQIKAKLIDIPRRMYYNACPDEFCSKKMDLDQVQKIYGIAQNVKNIKIILRLNIWVLLN